MQCNEKIEEMQTQINILTDYISLKDKMYNDKIGKLEEEIGRKNKELNELMGEYKEI
mgnify:CR=1 FL=1